MAKNIVIFSDGTGQRSGLFFDERRSNIYKLYRATRCAPDSCVDPGAQLAFYDPGIGTLPPGTTGIGTLWRRAYNLVSQALGLGLTGNIVDCYAAIIRLWRPGDRIFLFGFSRGAYTIRCLGAVIGLCGVPTALRGGAPLRIDQKTSLRIAREAVRRVYQHTSSWRRDDPDPRHREMLAQRRELARRFRIAHASGDEHGPNDYPHFIGVFDTVASLANPVALLALVVAAVALAGAASALVWYFLAPMGPLTAWWRWFAAVAVLSGLVAGAFHLAGRVKWEIGLPHARWWRPFHLAEGRMNFYDTQLDPNVGFARHALAIDERRASFQRVAWGDPELRRATEDGDPEWLEQVWFAGNHSDIGGSYPEAESRLSDISLQWMVQAATDAGLVCDPAVLRLFPDAAGPQHDEARSSLFRFAAKAPREIPPDARLHESVLDRLTAGPVLHYDVYLDYRPDNLRGHVSVRDVFAEGR